MKLPNLSPSWRSIIVGLIQLALVASLGAKLWYDRAMLPRVWVPCTGVDPDDPLRGRYVSLRLAVPFTGSAVDYGPARLRIDGSELVAEPAESYRTAQVSLAGRVERDGKSLVLLDPPMAVFLAEHAPDPTLRTFGEQLWIEVTVPEASPPRPIRLGIKRPSAAIVPLDVD